MQQLLDFPPFQELWTEEDSPVVRHVRDLERRIFDPKTAPADVDRLRFERHGVLKVLEIVQARAAQEREQTDDQPNPNAKKQRLTDTFLPRKLL